MKELFDPCVNRTLELIDGQVASLIKSGRSKPKVISSLAVFCCPQLTCFRWCLSLVALDEMLISTTKLRSIVNSEAF